MRFPVVALVAPAGGSDAFAQLLGPLPADLPAAVLVAWHLNPFRPSRPAAIPAERTAPRVPTSVPRPGRTEV